MKGVCCLRLWLSAGTLLFLGLVAWIGFQMAHPHPAANQAAAAAPQAPAAPKAPAAPRARAAATAEKVGINTWPMLGGTIHRNMANAVAKHVPDTWSVAEDGKKNIKWSVKVGSVAYGGPVIADGKLFVGTNNELPRDPKITGDKGVLMCFRASDGKFLWQAVHDKLPNPDANDYARQGIASTPVVEGKRLYYVSNRCELVCADTEGDPETGKAKFIWKLDMIKELDVYPCQLANCSPLILGDLVFTITGNGVDPGTHKLPKPKAPSFIAVNKKDGKVVWQSSAPGDNIMEGQWSNPVATVEGKKQVIFPGGDGYLYSFDPPTGKLLWKFSCNPKRAKFKPGGRGDRAYFIATPVIWEKKLYIGIGENPTDGPGVGHLWCIDITKEPKGEDRDLSPKDDNFDPKAAVNKDSALVWHYGGKVMPPPAVGGKELVFGRTLSTVAIHDGLLYAGEIIGYLHCLDARTGKKHWEFDLKGETWCSPFYADGKVFMGTDTELYIFEAGKKLKAPKTIDMDGAVKTPPVILDGILYITNGRELYAITAK